MEAFGFEFTPGHSFLLWSLGGFFCLKFMLLRLPKLKPLPSLQSEKSLHIVVPARNEAHQLEEFFHGLDLENSPYRLTVVDDASEDETSKIVSQTSYGLIRMPPKSDEGSSKSRACAAAAKSTQEDYLLFTDADTRHQSSKLSHTLFEMERLDCDLVSIVPYHQARLGFEKVIGSFYGLLLLFIGPYQKESEFASGAFLLFRSKAYERVGGHLSIVGELGEELALVKRIQAQGLKYQVLPFYNVYQIQMYSSWKEFHQGWNRIFRIGLDKNTTENLLLTLTWIVFLLSSLFYAPVLVSLLLWSAITLVMSMRLPQWGNFPCYTALLLPLGCLLLGYFACVSSIQNFLNLPVSWKNRSFKMR